MDSSVKCSVKFRKYLSVFHVTSKIPLISRIFVGFPCYRLLASCILQKGFKLPVEWTGLVCRMQYCRRQAANFLQRQPWFTTPLVERLVSSMYILNRKFSLPSAVFILKKADQTIYHTTFKPI